MRLCGMFCLPRVVDGQNDHIYFLCVLPRHPRRIRQKDGFPRFGMRERCAMIRADSEVPALENGGSKIWRQRRKRSRADPHGCLSIRARWLHAGTPQLKGDLLEIFVWIPNMIKIYANNSSTY